MKHIAIVVPIPMTIRAFFSDHVRAFAREYEVTLVFNGDDDFTSLGETVRCQNAPIVREIALLADLRALARLVQIFRATKPDLVHSMGPKAGLLAMHAAWLAGVPFRVHTFTGQVWATRRGFSRALLRTADRFIAHAATTTLADGLGQLRFLVENGVLGADSSAVLGDGSVSGVNLNRFRPDAEARGRVRSRLAFSDGDVVFVFLGRLKREKGVLELAEGFARLCGMKERGEAPVPRLLFVGPDEDGLRSDLAGILADHTENVRFIDYTECPEEFLAAGDVLCLPSHREGSGTAVIEAAAVGLPAIVAHIYGLEGTAVADETALLHDVGNAEQICQCLLRLLNDAQLRGELGKNARTRAMEKFSSERLTKAHLDLYARLLRGGQPSGHSQ